jgi:hypothetical protein
MGGGRRTILLELQEEEIGPVLPPATQTHAKRMQEPIQSLPPASKASLIIRKLLPSLRGQRQGDEMSRRRRIKLL